jgi:hypothetical protein
MNKLINRLHKKNKKQLQEIYYKMTNTHTNGNKKDIIKELVKPLRNTYKMENTHESQTMKLQQYLKNIYLFYQIKMDNTMITLLGEGHDLECLCEQENTKSVETYILEYLREKPTTKVLLEISDEFTPEQISRLGSFNLKNTYQKLIDEGFKENIVYFDIRYFYISKYMFIIAHDPQTFSQMSFKEIIENIILPFLKFLGDKIKMFTPENTQNIPSNKINYITPNIHEIEKGIYTGEMMKQIYDNFNNILINIDKLPKQTIRERLLQTWKQVMDWECIYNIFKSSTDCIVLTGRKHTENYIKILNESGPSITKEANCRKISPRDEIYNTFSGSVDSQGNKCLCDCISI